MFSQIAAVVGVITFLMRCLPALMNMLKAGKIATDEVQQLVKWFFKHKQAGAKTLYVVPEPVVNKAGLKRLMVSPKVSAVSDETLHKLAETGGAPGPVELELEQKYGVQTDGPAKTD